jgi:Rieske Fe-S protein
VVNEQRRRLIGAAGATVACAAVGCGGSPRGVAVPTSGDSLRLPLARFPDLARAGGRVEVDADGQTLLVIRESETSARALSLKCTHQGCLVGWSAESSELGCPCHGSRFTAKGEVVQGPAKAPLASYPATIEGEEVVVALAAPSTGGG